MIKLEVYWDKKSEKQGYSIIVNGRTAKDEVIKSTSDDKKIGILDELKRGLLSVKNYTKHEDLLMIILQDKLITKWFYTYKAERKYQKYLDKMDEISDIIEELDCKYRFTCLEDYITKKKVPISEVKEEKKFSLEEAFGDLL